MCVVLKLRGYSQENFVFDSANVQINPLDINTKESEFGPFKVDNRLFYTSSRERRLALINLDENTGRQMFDLYSGDLMDSVTVANSKPLLNSVNTSLNQGTCFFDKKTSKLYYAGNTPSTRKDKFKVAIFSTEFRDNKFLAPKLELLLPDTFVASHPMVNDNKLYFSSNLKGGHGKADIYTAELVDGKWTNIKNLDEVNSPYDDYFPFAINGKEIYFSSNRPGGFGKLDLYKYTFSDGNARVNNLGKPINSKGDDFGLFMEPKQESGYFSTNRTGDQDDIYHFRKTWPTFNDCVAAIKENYCYDLTDEKSLETDSLKGYFYEWDFGDGSKQKGISVTHCYLQPGSYVINLNIIDVSTRAVFLNQTALDLYVDSIVQLRINSLDTMLVNRKFTINTAGTYLPGKKITGYYFEVDGKRSRRESFEHNFTRLGKHTIKLGVEYLDLATKTNSSMCTSLDVTCVDSALWIPFEKRKIEEMVAKFDVKNIQAGKERLEDLNYDAELKFNQRLGLNREELSSSIKDYLGAESTKESLARIAEDKLARQGKNIGAEQNRLSSQEEEALFALQRKQLIAEQKKAQGIGGKNIGSDKNGLTSQEEQALLALTRKQQRYEQDRINDFRAKNIANNKSGLSDQEEEAFLAFQKKRELYEQQNKEGLNGKNIGGNKSGLSDQEEEAFLALQKKKEVFAQQNKDGFDGKNIGGNKSGLTDQEEEAFLAFQKKKELYEQQKKDGVNGKNIGGNKSGLSDQEEEAFLALQKKKEVYAQQNKDGFDGKNIGGNKSGLSDQEEEAFLAFQKKKELYEQQNKDGVNGKNIGGNKSGLTDQEEEAFLALQKKKEVYAQQNKDGIDGKNIGGNKSGLTDQEEEAFLTFQKKKELFEQQNKDGLNAKNIDGNKSGLSDQEEEAFLALKKKKELYAQQNNEGFSGKNLGINQSGLSAMDEAALLSFRKKSKMKILFNTRGGVKGSLDTLLNVEEKVDITFRVHLGKSKVKKDTAYLNSIGLVGVHEEYVDNEYYYTYKNEKQVSKIEIYYKKALKAGIKDPIVIAYNNNVLIPNQEHHFKTASFNETKKEQTLPVAVQTTVVANPPVVVKQSLLAKVFRKNKKAVDSTKVKADTLVAQEPVKKETPLAQVEAKQRIREKVEQARDTAQLVKNNRKPQDTLTPAPQPQQVAKSPFEEPPEKAELYFSPEALKPRDVKIEDLVVSEEKDTAPSKKYSDEFIAKFGDATAPDLEFRVQISAFKYRNRYDFPHLAGLGSIENTLTEGGITRISIGGVFNNYRMALEHSKKVIAAGQKDAFVTLFYKGKRVFLEDLEKMGIFLTK